MQQLDISLDSIGYIYSRQLNDYSSNHHQKLPLQFESVCHYYDILVHDPRTDSGTDKQSKLYQQFNKIITSPSTIHHHITPPIPRKREFIKNNERRQYLLDEFITTEANYLSSLKTFVSLIVEPLRQRSKDRQTAIIGQYECANIFMNIDEIVQVTENFYNDLIQFNTNAAAAQQQSLGDLCLYHMRQFTCYNKFLLGVHNAQIINEKQMKAPSYFHFIEKVIEGQKNGNQTVYDYLALPSQRVGRYTMYFKELMKHTTDDHPDLPGLHGSLLKAEEIANMTEEIHTQLMKIFRRLLQAIQYCPESLLSFQRRLVGYLDTIELDPVTMKPMQPVTLFLFSDKIMVVKRPSYEVDGLDLCGLDQRMYEGSERKDFCIRKEAITGKMKFIGWSSINDIDVSLLSSPDTDQTTQRSLEAYFQHDQQTHCFLLDQAGGGNSINREHFQTMDKIKLHFIYQFGKCKNEIKQSDQLLQSSYCQWNQHHFYANVYPTSEYHQVINKNEIALFYIEKNTVNIEAVLSNCFVAPNMVGFIVPHEKDDNYRFAIRSKCAIGNTANDEISLLTFRSNDAHQVHCAQNQLFGNLLACDRDLSKSAQLACSTAAHTTSTAPAPTTNNSNSRFSIIKQDLVRKKSKSTFKLFTALASPASKPSNKEKLGHTRSASSSGSGTTTASSNTTASPSSPSPSTPTRPRTTSTYSEYILGLETSGSSIYHSSSSASSTHSNNSIKSQHSHESRLTLQSLASKELLPQQSSLHRLASESSTSINQQRYFSPSFHPSRTASYEIQSAATKRVSEELYPIFTNNNNSSPSTTSKIDHLLSSRSRSPLSIREPTPAMIEPGSGFSTLQSQASSTISTFNSPMPHYQMQDHVPHHQRLMDNATPSPRPLSDLIIPIATPSSKEFSVYSTSADAAYKRSLLESDIHMELEERNKTILMLTSLLQKKEEEIDMLKADLDDSVSELGTVCDKYNSELDHLATMYSQEQLERPANPSPDTQIRKKLETTLRERNQWQLRATELEHQLRSLLLNQQQQQHGSKYGNARHSYHQQHHKRSLSHGGGSASSISRANNM
ncbi:hypothetical protein MAM1_0244d08631 [Mucor ambiguus]|uniref:DH domain-containing protein n=1 Tax=Mucor ambiguus TaxID=91626 RepID=A0A0C9MNP5_9FUNG|nr:hypothetical protein MAM1_0244d08631 [Mucor ambiguus]